MKNLKYICVVSLLVVGLGCSEDFLDKPLLNELNTSIYYANEDDAKAAIIACYECLGWYGENAVNNGGIYGGWLYRLDYSLTDLSHPGGNTGPEWANPAFWYTHDPSTPALFIRPWSGHFTGIHRANMVLEKIPGAKMDEAARKIILAEAKFIRALVYFNLVRLWGDVPVLEKVVTGDNLNTKRDPAEKAYELIIRDLEEAISELPLTWTGTELGRATKGAAMALLSKVYLTQGGFRLDSKTGDWAKQRDPQNSDNWTKALYWADQVIALNKYSLWQDSDLGGAQLASAIPARAKNTDKIKSGYQAAFWVENDGDLVNKESIFEIQFVSYWPGRWNSGNLRQEGTNTNDFDFPTGANGLGVVHFGYNNNHPRSKFVDSYEPGDKRKAATIVAPHDTVWLRQWDEALNTGGYYLHDSLYLNAYSLTYSPEGYCVRKWMYGYSDERESGSLNQKIIRYAEVLLIKAEALNEMGRTAEAFEPLNEVRRRAGLPDLSGLNQEELRDRIFEERKFELAYETCRLFDALRSGNLEKWVLADRDVPVQRHHNLLPIPQEAIDLDPSLTQNYGY